MQYSTLIAQIEADIYSNGAELITGNILQTVLKRMVSAWASAGAAYGGTISPDTVVPLSLDQATVYLALTAGTYEHFLDGEGDPIETTGPALVIYDGGPALIFSKTDLPSGGSGATVITGGPGDSLVVTLPKGDEGIKASYRIDMTAAVYGGDVDARYIGSFIIECNELAMQTARGYYYGDDMAVILSEVAIWKDDPEIYPDEQGFYLLLTINSDLNEVIFSVSSLDGQTVDADAANEDEKVKVADATITPVGSGGGDGKIGVISQTQTWSGTGSNPRTYVMSNPVTGLIPQANIDLFEAAGATFNETTGYFELNGLTDISYEEMQKIYDQSRQASSRRWSRLFSYATCRTNLPFYWYGKAATNMLESSDITNGLSSSSLEVFLMPPQINADIIQVQSLSSFLYNALYLKKILNPFKINGSTTINTFRAVSLEDININGLTTSVQLTYCSLLSLASVVYMVENAANTSAITITLHATAYARCQADTTEYTYQGNTYTGIIAYANARNITIASA